VTRIHVYIGDIIWELNIYSTHDNSKHEINILEHCFGQILKGGGMKKFRTPEKIHCEYKKDDKECLGE